MIPDEFQHFASAAIEGWAPGSRWKVLKELSGGRSGAPVLLVDIDPPHPPAGVIATPETDATPPSGEFILKLDRVHDWQREVEKNPDVGAGMGVLESERHQAACSHSSVFANAHIPALKRSHRDGEYVAMLYRVAGNPSGASTLEHLQTLESLLIDDRRST